MCKYVGVNWTGCTLYAKTMKLHIQPNVQQARAQNDTEPAQVRMCSCVNY